MGRRPSHISVFWIYSSSECQKLHWRSGHRNECHVPVSSRPSGSGGESVAVCNGKHPETSKSGVSTTVLNPISLGIFKSDSNKSTSVKKSSPSQVAKIPGNALTKDGSLPRPKSVSFRMAYNLRARFVFRFIELYM